MPLSPPFVLVDRYEVTHEIGRGGYAVVYRAADRVLGRDVAIKLLRDDAVSDDTLARFRQEMQITAQLEHAHILHVYDTGWYEGRPYIVMELAPGRTLADRLERERQLPIADALQIVRDVGLALAHAHARGVVHRDVKPENILLGTSGAILADFGIARVTLEGNTSKLTATGMAVGTVQYMSPEQLCAEPHIDGRSDQYALACVLYEMIAGVRPHIAATPEGLRLLRLTDRHTPVSAHRPVVPAHVSDALQTALHSMSADRFRSIEEFLGALGLAASGEHSAGASGALSALDPRRSGEAAAVKEIVAGPTSGTPQSQWSRARVATLAATVLAMLIGIAHFATRAASASATGAAEETGALTVIVSPFTDTDARAARVGESLRAELIAWPALRVVEGRSRVMSGLRIAPSLEELGDSTRLVFEVRDAAKRASARYEVMAPSARFDSASAVASTVSALVRQALAGVSSQLAPGVEALPDRSLSTLRAYVDGVALMRAGKLADASQRFRMARDTSPRFALAAFWAAQSGAWAAPANVASWRGDIDAAVRTNMLRGTDSLLAAGLQHRAAMKFVPACEAYRAATARDPASFTAWYGLGTCLRLDSAVVRTSAGLRFRSSHWEALTAYQRAVDLAPTSEWLAALFGPVLSTTYAQNGRMRAGWALNAPASAYLSLPSLEADTLAFFPLPAAAVLSSADGSVPPNWLAALRRARVTLLEITGQWVGRFPKSTEAWLVRATALELSGRIERGAVGESADAALDRVSDTSAVSGLQSRVTVARARLAMRRADVVEALRIAKQAAGSAAGRPPKDRAPLGALAAFAGDTALSTAFSRNLADDYTGLSLGVAELLHRFQSSAVQGVCAGLAEQMIAIENQLKNSSSTSELDSLRQRWLRPAYRNAVPCLSVRFTGGFSPKVPLDFVFAAIAKGDRKAARAMLDDLQASRKGASLSALSWDYLYTESWALAEAGDTAHARTQLTGALDDIASMSMYTFDLVPQAAGLRRAILLLRDISPKSGTVSSTESKWVQRANALLTNSKGEISK